MNIVFMGTPDFAVPALKALAEHGHKVTAVITQPDKPKGRGKAVQMSPVKEAALALGIPVYQPAKVREEHFLQELEAMKPEVIVVAAFGQILSQRLLDIPAYGCINIHASLLPKYRGAAPIQWAIIDGEKETGVTTMQMDAGIDTGDILEKRVVPIAPEETGGSLHDKLGAAGGELILSTLEKLEKGGLVPVPQTEEGTRYAKMLDKTLGKIDWSREAAALERLIRGLNPWPSAYTGLDGKTLKLWQAKVMEEEYEGEPGQVIKAEKSEFWVKTGKGTLAVLSLQLEGRKRMDAGAFLRGYPVARGTILR